MSENPSQHDDVAGADDLTRIGGIGSEIAERLHAAGIRTYADLASRSAVEIIKLANVSDMSTARLDSWRDQARELAAAAEAVAAADAAAAQAAPQVPAEAPGNGQHYESFLVRVLLNEDGSIRRMTARHIRTGAERHWPGLEREALPDFIQTAIASAAPSPKAPAEPPSSPAEPRPAEPRPAAALGAPAEPSRAGLPSSAVLSVEPAVLRAAEPFTMTMTIDLAEQASHADRLAYSAVIVARPMAGGPKRTVAESDGLVATTSPAITIDAAGLPPGMYRLDGAVSLREPGRDHPAYLAAMAEGLLVRVLPA